MRLPPLLGEPFGSYAGLVNVGGRKASDRASRTEVDPSLALSKMAAANQTPVLDDDGKDNPTAEVTDLLKLEIQFLVGPEPVHKEATYRRSTLHEFDPPVQDHIFGDAAHHSVEITTLQSLNLLAHKLNQVGRGGLPSHLPASIPRTDYAASGTARTPLPLSMQSGSLGGHSCFAWMQRRVRWRDANIRPRGLAKLATSTPAAPRLRGRGHGPGSAPFS